MSITGVITNQRIYIGSYEMTGKIQSTALVLGMDMKGATVYGNTTNINKGGLKTVGFSHEALWDSTIDSESFSGLGTADVPLTIGVETGAKGEVAYIAKLIRASYQTGSPVGELLPANVNGHGVDAIRGTILENKSATSTANGTAYQVGAVSSTQTLYACLHVVSVSGTNPTLDVVVASDDNESFTSGASRVTFTQATAITSEFLTLAGPVTDDWWRVEYTIGGTDTPTFEFIITIGIL